MNKTYVFLVTIFSLLLVPSFGSFDKANAQWLFLSFIPLFFFTIHLKKSILFNRHFIIYSIFIFQAVLSLLYSNNLSISLVDLSRHLVLFVLVFLLANYFISYKLSFYILSIIISSFLIYESFYSLRPLLYYVNNTGDFSLSNITSLDIDPFKGLTGNRNITTASFVIKLPFLFYLIFKSRIYLKLFFSSLAIFPLISFFIINSRAALLSLIIIVLLFTLYFILYNRKKLFNLFFIYAPILISFYISYEAQPSTTSTTTERLSSIALTNESSSYRFFLWENAFDYIKLHPFVGCGIGNWKVESAAYWGSTGSDYIVPFHAHNDFLEFTTELGLLGGLSYLILFLVILHTFSSLFYKFKELKFLILVSSFIALFIDSLLNFPFERPIIQSMFVLFVSLAIHFSQSYAKKI